MTPLPTPAIIYGLIDPRFARIVYIGKTTNDIGRRNTFHNSRCRSGTSSTPGLTAIYDEIIEEGYDGFDIVELDRLLPDESLDEREQDWIAFYRRRRYRLCNVAAGGAGQHGTAHTAATKEKISEGVKAALARRK